MTIFTKDFTRQRSKQDELVKQKIPWYCNKCWQEGEVVVERPRRDLGRILMPNNLPAATSQHDRIIAGIPGAKCSGNLLPQVKSVKSRIKRQPGPELAGIDDNPTQLS